MASNRPTSAELPALLTNLAFEVEVLAWSIARARELEHAAEVTRNYQAAIDRSAYVNAALAAARNILLFFANDRWKKGAVIADDVVPGWNAVPGGRMLGVVNHQVVHIGLGRVRNPQPVDLDGLVADIDVRLGTFYGQVDPSLQERVHPSIASALRAVTVPGKRR